MNDLQTLRFELADNVARVTFNLHAAITRLTRGSAPVIAAVQGPAAGAGFSVACAEKLVKQLASGPTWAFGAAKELVMRSFSEDLESQMEFESQAIANAARTEDAAEGIAAFFEKRRASFRGR